LTLDNSKEAILELIRSNINGYPGKHVKHEVDDPELAFATARDIAKQKAKAVCDDPMLLSWFNGETGESYPDADCGPGHKPAWIIYAESRGGDLTVDINQGNYVFIFLSV
jgi:hypothetical protein